MIKVTLHNTGGWYGKHEQINIAFVKHYKSDIFIHPECKLKPDQSINISGYKYFGNNRIARNSRISIGSGGIGILISDLLLDDFSISNVDKVAEGIIVILLEHKTTNFKVLIKGA